jgi:glyoxylase-like metal-dependent hydrolase (beta-lactamase superfamily II)
MSKWQYTKGLHEIGNGAYAWLQPDGGLCLSNAGLLVDGDTSLLVDTLIDLPLTREMLNAMKRISPAAADIDVLVNTHANLDHTFGNQLVGGAEIIASAACAEEMMDQNPGFLHGLRHWQELGERGQRIHRSMGHFDFDDIVITPPTRTFDGGRITVPLGSREIEVIHVGPAHTRGDVIVYSPTDRIVYTGDVMFIGGHPVIWVGPWSNWIKACETILSLDVDVIVPGHGCIVDKAGACEMLDWIVYLKDQAKARYDAGLSLEDTVREIEVYAPIDSWIDRDRIVTNVNLLFQEFGGRGAVVTMDDVIRVQEKLGLMAPLGTAETDLHAHTR